MSETTTTADLTPAVAVTEFAPGQTVMAWEPHSEKFDVEGTTYWRGEYRAAVVIGVAAINGPAGEPWYMIEWAADRSSGTFRDEGDLLAL